MDNDELRARLEAVEWAQYGGGTAYDSIPRNFVALRASTAKAVEEAAVLLERSLLPRASLTEVAYYAIPFLVDLAHEMPDNEPLYELLMYVALCAAPDDPDEEGPEIQVDGGPRLLGDVCRERISVGLETYMSVVADRARARESRSSAITILVSLPEHRAQWLPLLERLHVDEPDPEIRAHLTSTLDNERRRASR